MALNNAARLLSAVIDLVQQAGTRLAAEWQRPGGPRGAGDKAAIDLEIETFLRPRLLTLLLADFWGEETGQALNGQALCWVVDPNDGTADFLNGIAGSAIAVGLLQDALPVLGVVYAPVTVRGPDCIGGAEGLPGLLRNGRRLQLDLSGQTLNPHGLVMVSAAARGKPQLNASLCAPADFEAMPSIAYRLARVAAGDGVCGVSLWPVSAHDVVAGHALLRCSAGVLLDEAGVPVRYATAADLGIVSQRCFGGAPSVCRELCGRPWQLLWD
jgi:myo-inositol-1(or 4)-monophosphatase